MLQNQMTSMGWMLVGLLAFSCQQQDFKTATANDGQNLENADAIVGGRYVSDSDVVSRTTVGLYDRSRGSVCTSTILSKRILLTAAHCVGAASDLFAFFGPDMADPKFVIATDKLRVYHGYNPHVRDNTGDMALVKLAKDIPAGYKAARMFTRLGDLRTGDNLLMAGYGVSRYGGGDSTKLRKVVTPIAQVNMTRTEMLFDQRGGRGVCSGDSGGPAYIKIRNSNEYAVVGVASRVFGPPGRTCRNGGIHTTVAAYEGWIKRTMDALK